MNFRLKYFCILLVFDVFLFYFWSRIYINKIEPSFWKPLVGKPGGSFFVGNTRTLCGVLRAAAAKDQHLLSGADPYFDELIRLDENIFVFNWFLIYFFFNFVCLLNLSFNKTFHLEALRNRGFLFY